MNKNLPWFFEQFAKNDPEYCSQLAEVLEVAAKPEKLDAKTKYLIILALDVLKGAGEGVKVLAKQARDQGASEDEIREVIRLAFYVNSMDVIKTSLNAY
ncbi:MAG: carboxymuconolactone decarboxylase family protein [Syntrophomonadaceae bacterium]|nr:carboxymuconolactone decarboxylase family protein [Syntrophomonadaceae bacterium]MDD3023703.1 carboxymuconolactone decarboxylase family protein [Syntrophomonadaceae bacterium]